MSKHLETIIPLRMFKQIVDDSSDGYMLVDGSGTVVYTNTEYLRVANRLEEGMVGHNMQEYIDEGSLDDSIALKAIEEKRQVMQPLMIRNKVPLSITSTPVFRGGKLEYVVTITRDISLLNTMKKNLDNLLEFLKNYEKNGGKNGTKSDDIVIVSEPSKRVFDMVDKIKDVKSTVILYGESGVGKDVVARYIHNNGVRKYSPFISINCSAIPEPILETELFGYVGGTFTGADKRGKMGLFEAAHNGTLFLDEVGDMTPELQVKLLRVLESQVITRVGDHKEIPVDVRIIAATNKNLEQLVRLKGFREDLFYRLNVLPITIPPLRERVEDITPLCLFYLKQFNKHYNMNASISRDALKYLEQHRWPGNIRELKNIIERLVVTSGGSEITIIDIELFTNWNETLITTEDVIVKNIIPLNDAVAETERQLLIKAKQKYKSCREIADVLGIDYSTVSRKLKHYKI